MAVGFVLWHYEPTLIAAIIFAVAFGVLSLTHLGFRVRTSSKFCNCLIVGGIFETVGYAARAAAHFSLDSKIAYAVQSLFILLGPILFAASTYMVLGRIILGMGGEDFSPVPTRWLTKMFVAGDILCFVIQAGGGAILSGAKSENMVNIGNWVIFAGLVVQVMIFGVFIVCTVIYHFRANRFIHSASPQVTSMPWVRMLVSIYAVSGLIMGRNVYRMVEYILGSNGYIQLHEWTLYVFDAALMTILMSVCMVWYHSFLRQDFAVDEEKQSSTVDSVNV